MSLEITINSEIKTAMLAKNEAALRALRAIKSAILLAKTAEGNNNGELSEDDEIKILQKLAKQRRDSLEIFQKQQRDDLSQKEKEELDVIEKFLPKQMDEAELKIALQEIMKNLGASSPADMGKVMGAATKQLAGKADGKLISALVKELLQS